MTLQNATLSGGTSPLKEWLVDAFHRPDTAAYRVTLRVTFFLIILSVLTVIVETAPAIYAPLAPVIDALELVILAAFTAEYIAHVYVEENRRKYILSWWGLIDLLGILTSVIGRSMLSSLFGVEEGEEPAAESAVATDAEYLAHEQMPGAGAVDGHAPA